MSSRGLRWQDPAAGGQPGWLSWKDDAIRARFTQLLLDEPTRDLAVAWQFGLDVGRPAVPLLWDMLGQERSNIGRRLMLLAAAVTCGGPAEDKRLFDWLAQDRPMLEERVMAAILLALGPRRARAMPRFWSRCMGPSKSPEPVLVMAVRLAAARFPGAEADAPPVVDEDVGVLAATAFASLPLPTAASRLWNTKTPERHAELFWRAALLAAARQRDAAAAPLDKARWLLASTADAHASVRAAAALFLARIGEVRGDGPRPDWQLLQILASEPAGAAAMQAWLAPGPHGLNEDPRRIAVSYAMSRAPEVVIAEQQRWSLDPRIRTHVAVALAWRLLGEEQPRPIDVSLPAVPEWFFVRWASGAAADPRDAASESEILQRAARLAAAGRLPRPVLRQLLEEALWRWGSHPGLCMWENEAMVVRDLLLVGSLPGGKFTHASLEQRFRPGGLPPNNVLFDVAVALYDFLSRAPLPLPPEHRLR